MGDESSPRHPSLAKPLLRRNKSPVPGNSPFAVEGAEDIQVRGRQSTTAINSTPRQQVHFCGLSGNVPGGKLRTIDQPLPVGDSRALQATNEVVSTGGCRTPENAIRVSSRKPGIVVLHTLHFPHKTTQRTTERQGIIESVRTVLTCSCFFFLRTTPSLITQFCLC